MDARFRNVNAWLPIHQQSTKDSQSTVNIYMSDTLFSTITRFQDINISTYQHINESTKHHQHSTLCLQGIHVSTTATTVTSTTTTTRNQQPEQKHSNESTYQLEQRWSISTETSVNESTNQQHEHEHQLINVSPTNTINDSTNH